MLGFRSGLSHLTPQALILGLMLDCRYLYTCLKIGLVILFCGSDVNITFDFFKELWDSLGKDQLVTPLPGDMFNKQEALEFYWEVLMRRKKRN